MLKSVLSALVVLCFGLSDLMAQPDTVAYTRTYSTKRTSAPPVIDGDISDDVWNAVEWADGFIQRSPYDGSAPTQLTAFRILYDDHALYICFRAFDTEPEKIESRMARRDYFPGDLVEINIDSYHDKRTAFSFTPSASGVKGDEFITDDGNYWDTSWDPVWKMKTKIDSLGWTAEAMIPLSQLRFSNAEEQVWGLQVMRHDFRMESRSFWQPIPINASYWVSGFGELHGISGIRPKRQIEIQPYVLSQLDLYEAEPGNPFADGTETDLSVGVDGKFGITNDISVDFTINPDFGQVESDPSVLTLDGFQIFFDERRPFFIQNRDLFNYQISSSDAGGGYDSDNLFYSRRIGAGPHASGSGNPDSLFFVDQPLFTSILGAAKVSGKTQKGLSIGILEAVTQREEAEIRYGNGDIQFQDVEPLSNYFVGRVKQDFNEGNTIIGGLITSVHRNIDASQLEFLHTGAQSAAVDFLHRWKDRTWQFNARMVVSRVAGSAQAIQRTQTSFEHGFTRPDGDHLDYDSEATELVGQGGNVSIAKYGDEFKFQTGVTWRSPKLELNDIGFMRRADEINHYYWMGYHENDPYWIFLNTRVNYNHWSRWDFGGTNLYRAVNANVHATFKNYWNVGTGGTYENLDLSATWLRGGPIYRRSAGMGTWMYINSDQRKKFSVSVEGNVGFGFDFIVRGQSINGTVRYQPSDAVSIAFGPSFENFERIDQYVATRSYLQNARYILGHVHQRTLSFTGRLNVNITPDFTIQYYGQPFISRGRYRDFNYVVDPMESDKTKGLYFYQPDQLITTEEGYAVDEDRDGFPDYEFGNPAFKFVQFRSNLVMRWEYIPGSEIYLVWTQGNTDFGQPDDRGLFESLQEDFLSDEIRNSFLLKLTYRFLNK